MLQALMNDGGKSAEAIYGYRHDSCCDQKRLAVVITAIDI